MCYKPLQSFIKYSKNIMEGTMEKTLARIHQIVRTSLSKPSSHSTVSIQLTLQSNNSEEDQLISNIEEYL